MAELHSSNHHFGSPPVYETALTVQFEELREFRTIHFGQFYSRISEDFPIAEDKPRAEPIREMFPKIFGSPQIHIIPKKHGPERVWYRDRRDGSFLLQLQPDRISLNWRKISDSEHYPSFAENGPLFLDAYRKFQDFCGNHDLGKLEPNLSEVVYVNRILPEQGESAIESFGRIFTGLEWKHSEDFLPQPEIASFNRVYEIGEQEGRFYAEAGIAKHPELGEFVQLNITARILIDSEERVVASLQKAHDWVVNGFVSLTTPDSQFKRWKRSEA